MVVEPVWTPSSLCLTPSPFSKQQQCDVLGMQESNTTLFTRPTGHHGEKDIINYACSSQTISSALLAETIQQVPLFLCGTENANATEMTGLLAAPSSAKHSPLLQQEEAWYTENILLVP